MAKVIMDIAREVQDRIDLGDDFKDAMNHARYVHDLSDEEAKEVEEIIGFRA